jgi:hypothetical protein
MRAGFPADTSKPFDLQKEQISFVSTQIGMIIVMSLYNLDQ